MFHPGDEVDGGDELAPSVALRGEDFAARGRQAVVAPAAPSGLLDPAAQNPAAAFEAVEQRVERGDVEAEHAARALLDEAADVVAVPRLVFDQREDEQLGAPLLQLPREDVRPDICHSHILQSHACPVNETFKWTNFTRAHAAGAVCGRKNTKTGPPPSDEGGGPAARSLMNLLAAREYLAELGARLVELRLGGADGAAEEARDLVVVVALHVVEDEGRAVAGRESGDGALQGEAVNQLRRPRLRDGDARGLVRDAALVVFERLLAPRLVL